MPNLVRCTVYRVFRTSWNISECLCRFMFGSTGFVCPDQWSEAFAPEAKTGEAAQSVAKVTSKLARPSAEFMGIQAQLGPVR